MSSIVLTSENRILGLPVKLEEIHKGEKIVATNADMGMLFVDESTGKEILKDYSEIDPENLPEGSPICVPYIEDYKSAKIEELKEQIKEFEDLTD
jgi:hypothetical protein